MLIAMDMVPVLVRVMVLAAIVPTYTLPKFTLIGEILSVAALFTVCETLAEVLPLKLLSPK